MGVLKANFESRNNLKYISYQGTVSFRSTSHSVNSNYIRQRLTGSFLIRMIMLGLAEAYKFQDETSDRCLDIIAPNVEIPFLLGIPVWYCI